MKEDLNFYQYVNDKSILVITPTGKLKRLYCPFPVYLKNTNQHNYIKKILMVERITLNADNKICYVINGKADIYSGFIIVG